MIDVWFVAANGLWIAGLSVLLAAWSWASWAASVGERRLRVMLVQPGVQRAVGLGMALFCAGLAATGRWWWGRALWAALAVGGMVHVVVSRPDRVWQQPVRSDDIDGFDDL